MIHFEELSNVNTLCAEHNITKMIIPLSVDTLADCNIYRSISEKYPDLDSKFISVTANRTPKSGDFIRIQTETGHIVYFIIIRTIEKFQPYYYDMIKALTKVVESIRREVSATTISAPNSVLFPLPSSDELKISDAIFVPAIADTLNLPDIEVFLLCNGDYSAYVEQVTPTAIYYKRDSWKSDWMLSLDDVLFINIIAAVTLLLHDYKINKNNLVRCYYICNRNGMYPKLEFYDTEYGKFFKLFLLKSNSLINHGLLMNVHHYSNADPKKFSCIIGPMFSHLKQLAYTQIENNRERINLIANEIRQDYFEQLKLRRDDPNKQPFPKPGYQKPESNASSFNF